MTRLFDELLRNRIIVGVFLCLFSAGKACVIPFLTLLFKNVGLTVFQAGILRAVQALVSVIFAPILLQVAKKYHKRRLFVAIGILVTSVTYISLIFIPEIKDTRTVQCVNEQCENPDVTSAGVSYETTYVENTTSSQNASAKHSESKPQSPASFFVHPEIMPCVSDEENGGYSKAWCLERLALFLIFLLILTLCGIMGSHVEKLVDDSWYEHLEEIDSLERYGEHKSFITGFTAITLLVACATVSTAPPHPSFNLQHFLLYFFTFLALNSIAFLTAPFLPIPNAKQKETTNYRKVFRSFQIIFCDYRNLLFTASVIFSGGFHACVQDYLLWYLQDEGAKEYILGLLVCVGIASELPIPVIYKALIKTLTLNGAVATAIFVFGFRFIYYSLCLKPIYILLAQLFQGLSNGLIWQATLVHIDQVSNPGMDRHVHSLLYILYWGVGYSIGSLSGGVLFFFYGAELMFWAFGSFAFIWGLLFLAMQWYMPHLQKRTYSKLLLSGADDSERMYRLLNSSSGESDDDNGWMQFLSKKKEPKKFGISS